MSANNLEQRLLDVVTGVSSLLILLPKPALIKFIYGNSIVRANLKQRNSSRGNLKYESRVDSTVAPLSCKKHI